MTNNLVKLFSNIAEAIRIKSSKTDKIKPENFYSEILNIPQEKIEEKGNSIRISQFTGAPFSEISQKVNLTQSKIIVKQVFKNEETGEFTYGE